MAGIRWKRFYLTYFGSFFFFLYIFLVF
jgi:hypothetical protein